MKAVIAARAHLPYAVHVDHAAKRYFFVNRDYKTLGTPGSAPYETYPFSGGSPPVHLFGDGTAPWVSHRHYVAYVVLLHGHLEDLKDYTELGTPFSDHFLPL